ncbi:MAG: L,D-transpeptidase family protein [Rhizobiales bacterium]|nr:L,D-transpeptidase family protein [Hyphomicrobiales bacterium]
MTLRATSALIAFTFGIAASAGMATAQYYPPYPQPYPPAGVQSGPPPYDPYVGDRTGSFRPPAPIPNGQVQGDQRYPFEPTPGDDSIARRDELQGRSAPTYSNRQPGAVTRDERLPADDNYRVPPPTPPGLEWLFPRLPQQARPVPPAPPQVASLPPDDQPEEETGELPEQFKRQLVDFPTIEPAGSVIIDTPRTYLYYVLGGGKAIRYGIGVGRDGFTWAGIERISKMAEWPDWHPPAEMIERQPYLPRFMAGGPGNPLGARALYLGKTIYRIHGTNQPSTIGKFVSSGCIRMLNEDVEDLYGRVQLGTRVVVLAGNPTAATTTR